MTLYDMIMQLFTQLSLEFYKSSAGFVTDPLRGGYGHVLCRRADPQKKRVAQFRPAGGEEDLQTGWSQNM